MCIKRTILILISLRYKRYDEPLSSRWLGLQESFITVHQRQENEGQENGAQHKSTENGTDIIFLTDKNKCH